ncbi:hypothetical protein B0T21DRAFT_106767 [Apiosordaria backusii]|uniref:Uncharacterized protein n=1 Tax=Apiosordaria backusii TaxID=314023 RepID=A0AA39ZUS5_9PEZI|nr:hypothetical protein B0T21DRAFT_106767 [Apiosordaria backusii]
MSHPPPSGGPQKPAVAGPSVVKPTDLIDTVVNPVRASTSGSHRYSSLLGVLKEPTHQEEEVSESQSNASEDDNAESPQDEVADEKNAMGRPGINFVPRFPRRGGHVHFAMYASTILGSLAMGGDVRLSYSELPGGDEDDDFLKQVTAISRNTMRLLRGNHPIVHLESETARRFVRWMVRDVPTWELSIIWDPPDHDLSPGNHVANQPSWNVALRILPCRCSAAECANLSDNKLASRYFTWLEVNGCGGGATGSQPRPSSSFS